MKNHLLNTALLVAIIPLSALASPWSLRGGNRNGRAILAVDSNLEVRLELTKQDLNARDGEDDALFRVISPNGQTLGEWEIPDDGNASSGFSPGALATTSIVFTAPYPGFYAIEHETSYDSVFDLSVAEHRWGLDSASLELYHYQSRDAEVFFAAPFSSNLTFNVRALHEPARGATVRMYDSETNEVASVTPQSLHDDNTVVCDVPAELQGTPWWIYVPAQDIELTVSGVSLYSTSGTNLLLNRCRLIPDAAVIGMHPGTAKTVEFVLKNSTSGPTTNVCEITNVYTQFADVVGGPEWTSNFVVTAGGCATATVDIIMSESTVTGTSAYVGLSVYEDSRLQAQASLEIRTSDPAVPGINRPFLNWTTGDLARAHLLIAGGNPAWASNAHECTMQAADIWISTPHSIPRTGGDHQLLYVDPVSATPLYFDETSPTQHYSWYSDTVLTGEEYDGAWTTKQHMNIAYGCSVLAMAYGLTGDTNYAGAVCEHLLEYADFYAFLPVLDADGLKASDGGRVTSTSLEEATWLIPIVIAYDAVADSGLLSAGEQVDIEQNVIMPAARHLSGVDYELSNIQAWHNAAVGLAGYCMGDTGLISFAVSDSNHSFTAHLRDAVREDGFWHEGSIAYHYYVLSAYDYLCSASRESDNDLFRTTVNGRGIEEMLAAPLQLVTPDLRLRMQNDDFGPGTLFDRHAMYETANREFANPLYDGVLEGLVNSTLHAWHPFEPAWAFSWGKSLLNAATHEELDLSTLRSTYSESSGTCVLRNDDLVSIIDSGPHGGNHGHYDALHLSLWGNGHYWLADPGTVTYTLPQHEEWYSSTISHNTVVIDESPQGALEIASSPGLLGLSNTLKVVQVTCGEGVYPSGVSVSRLVALTDTYVIMADGITGCTNHIADWFLHGNGELFLPNTNGLSSAVRDWAGHAQYGYIDETLINRTPQTGVVEQVIEDTARVHWRKRNTSIGTDFEDGISWPQMRITTNAAEGMYSALWVVEPGVFERTRTRVYTGDECEMSSYDTLNLSIMVSSDDFDYLDLVVDDLPAFPGHVYRILEGTSTVTGTWQDVSVDLSSPIAVLGSESHLEQIHLRFRGLPTNGVPFKCYVDDLTVSHDGITEVIRQSSLQVSMVAPNGSIAHFGEGPGQPPFVDWPLICVQLPFAPTNEIISVLVPSPGTATTHEVVFSNGVVIVAMQDMTDHWCVDALAPYAVRVSSMSGDSPSDWKEISFACSEGQTDFTPWGKIDATSTTYGSVVCEEGDNALVYSIHLSAPATLTLYVPDRMAAASVNGTVQTDAVLVEPSLLVLPELPAGRHLLKVSSSAVTGIDISDSGEIELSFIGHSNSQYVVDSSTDLLSWVRHFPGFGMTNGHGTFLDNDTNSPTKFYRITATEEP